MSNSLSTSSALHLFTTVGGIDCRVLQCSCTDPSFTVLILGSGSTVFLSGSFAFQILYGYVSANGYLFSPGRYNSSNFVNVSIHQGHLPAAFSIRDDLSTEVHMERIQSRMREFVSDPRKVFKFVEERKPIAIILFKTEMDIITRFIGQQTKKIANLFPKMGKQLGKNLYCFNLHSTNETGMTDNCWTAQNTDSLKRLEDDYRRILYRIYRILEQEDCCIVPIVGNKGVGKSTASRYLINSLKTGEHDQPPRQSCRTFLLDLDVGQSECSPPGCISLYEPKKPMIGAPFVSQESSLANSYFFGSNNIGIDFGLYEKLIELLLQRFRSIMAETNDEKFVLIVNTAGWIEDLGYDLMLRVLRILKPNLMVCLEMNGTINFEIPRHLLQKIAMRIRKDTNEHPKLDSVFRPAHLRSFLVAGYLAQVFHQLKTKISATSDLRLADNALAYRLPFRCASIYIHPELRHVQDKFMLNALNFSFVSLCRVEEAHEKCFERRHLLDDPSLPARLVFRPYDQMSTVEEGQLMDEEDDIIPLNCPSRKQFPVLRCVGFGLIRAINPERRLFYIITPVEQRQLAQVDVLALGHCLNTPQLIFDTNSCETLPYLVELRENAFGDHQKKLFSPLRAVTGMKRARMAQFLHQQRMTNGHMLSKKARFG